MGYNTATPENVNEMKVDDVLQYIKDTDNDLPPKSGRLGLIKAFYKILGFDLSPDSALAMTAEPRHMLIVAPAGGGKTTQVTVKVAVEKTIRPKKLGRKLHGKRVLCLVYNESNVAPMLNMHRKMVTRLMFAGIEGLDIDTDLRAHSLHSFCESWIREYAVECGISGFTVIADNQTSTNILSRCFTLLSKKFQVDPKNAPYDDLLGMYQLAAERLSTIADPAIRDNFPNIKYETPFLLKVFEAYEAMKVVRKKYDFIDQMLKFKKLMETNADALRRVQEYHDLIVADEIQDFSPLKMYLLQKIVGDNQLIAIGDEDQAIYVFNGADPNNALLFKNFFPEGEIYVLNTNRRCPQVILDHSLQIIESNTNRFKKDIRAIKQGGIVEMAPYSSEEGQLIKIANEIEAMTLEQRSETVIAYRNKVFSRQLGEMLESRGIGATFISGFYPYTHNLYGHVQNFMDLLHDPNDPYLHLHLFKVLPITKDQLYDVLGYDAEKRKFTIEPVRKHFGSLDFGEFANRNKFARDLQKLIDITLIINRVSMKEYFLELFGMFRNCYWNYMLDVSNTPELDIKYTNTVFETYNVDDTYDNVLRRITERKKAAVRKSNLGTEVSFSTFHKLKGLEFDTVYLTHLNEGIMPALDNKNPNADVDANLSVETSLMYVAMTRAKKRLVLSYYEHAPSMYIRMLQQYRERINISSASPKAARLEMMDIIKPSSSNAAAKSLPNFKASAQLGNLFKRQ